MKPRFAALAQRIDALGLRQRALLFFGAAALIVVASGTLLLQPLALRLATVREQIRQQYLQIASIDGDITQRVLVHAEDPDAAAVARLAAVRLDSARLAERLRSMRSSLVAPENMAPLLAQLLKVNGKLRLDSLATLAQSPSPGPTGSNGAATAPLFYRHGVRLAVSGSYADMVAYMAALEAMPTQLFWGSVRLDAGAYPQASLTLTMYTLSLDPTWISL
ncbi:hypothetical protein [Massilia sp. PWRC2]|uniref:hypothetical protein n=1 Tax=Massilia sp. PWRC2 TaxID=2804626 RepID=UPI003CF3DB44